MEKELVSKIKKRKEYLKSLGISYNESPKFSVIITSFNQKQNIRRMINSLRDSNLIDEIVVCEDGSIDGSLEEWCTLLDRPNEFVINSNDLHEIRSTARAIKMTNSELVCIIQDDDIIHHNSWINEATQLFNDDNKLGILGGLGAYTNYLTDLIKKKRRKGPKWPNAFSYVENGNIGPFFIRKKYFEEIDGWDFNLSAPGEMGLGFDHEICYRMWRFGYHVGHYLPYGFDNNEQQGGTYSINGVDARNKKVQFVDSYLREKYKIDEVETFKQKIKELNLK